MADAPKVFISHTSADHELVEKFAVDLERDGCEVWLDDVKMHIGARYLKRCRRPLAMRISWLL